MYKMKHVFYVSLFLLCFNILYSLNIQNLNLKHANDVMDLKTYKNILNRKFNGDNRRRNRHENPGRAKSSESTESSSSTEKMKWKDEWKQYWLKKKLEALNSSIPGGDKVNMAAARPWGVPCGDPKQHGVPWGSCMLPMECESEYRIYRGDYFCGRTRYICCALHLTNYDMYGGIDASFADSNFETDSEERYFDEKGSKDRKKRKRERERKRRRKEREDRKRRIKKIIKKIMKEIKKVLNRSFRNGTLQRKKKTKEIKLFIKDLKKKYKYDRRLVRDVHEAELIKIDKNLQKRLQEIQHINRHVLLNDTLRQIILNGTINRKTLRVLLKEYPELGDLVQGDATRRSGGRSPDYFEYDVEYGYLYV